MRQAYHRPARGTNANRSNDLKPSTRQRFVLLASDYPPHLRGGGLPGRHDDTEVHRAIAELAATLFP